MFWRSIPSLQTILAGGVGLLMLELVVAYQPVQAQSCTVDPLGSEVCLPDSTPEEPDQPDKPKKSNQSNKPKQTQTNGDRAAVLRAMHPIPPSSSLPPVPERGH